MLCLRVWRRRMAVAVQREHGRCRLLAATYGFQRYARSRSWHFHRRPSGAALLAHNELLQRPLRNTLDWVRPTRQDARTAKAGNTRAVLAALVLCEVPSMESIEKAVQLLGLVNALLLTVAVAIPLSVDFDEVLQANERFASGGYLEYLDTYFDIDGVYSHQLVQAVTQSIMALIVSFFSALLTHFVVATVPAQGRTATADAKAMWKYLRILVVLLCGSTLFGAGSFLQAMGVLISMKFPDTFVEAHGRNDRHYLLDVNFANPYGAYTYIWFIATVSSYIIPVLILSAAIAERYWRQHNPDAEGSLLSMGVCCKLKWPWRGWARQLREKAAQKDAAPGAATEEDGEHCSLAPSCAAFCGGSTKHSDAYLGRGAPPLRTSLWKGCRAGHARDSGPQADRDEEAALHGVSCSVIHVWEPCNRIARGRRTHAGVCTTVACTESCSGQLGGGGDSSAARLLLVGKLGDTDGVGSNLHHLVVRNKLHGLVKREYLGGVERHVDLLVAAHIGGRLLLARVHLEVPGALMDAHNHAIVHLGARLYDELAALLAREQRVAGGVALRHGHQRAVLTRVDVARPVVVAVADGVDHARAASGREQRVAQADEAARRDAVLDRLRGAGALARGHLEHEALAAVQQVNGGAHVLFGHLHLRLLVRLLLLALLAQLGDHARRAQHELEALAAHRLDEDGDVERAAPADDEGVGGLARLHAHGQVALELLVQAVLEVPRGHELALLPRVGRGVHHHGHAHGGLLHRDGLHRGGRLLAGDGLADHDVGQPRHGDDVARLRALDGGAHEVLVREHLRHLAAAAGLARLEQLHLLPLADGARVHAPDGDAPLELVVVDVGHQHLQRRGQAHARRAHLAHDGVEERLEAVGELLRIGPRDALEAGGVDHWEVALLVGGAELAEELEGGVDHVVGARVGAVDLVHHHHHLVVLLQRLLQHEARLRHGPLHRVHQQQHAVHHVQHALHFPAEVRVPRCVDEVDLGVAVCHRGVLGQDGDAALPLQVVGVHDALLNRLVVTEHLALLEHRVHERRLAVVDVRDDGHVANLLARQQVARRRRRLRGHRAAHLRPGGRRSCSQTRAAPLVAWGRGGAYARRGGRQRSGAHAPNGDGRRDTRDGGARGCGACTQRARGRLQGAPNHLDGGGGRERRARAHTGSASLSRTRRGGEHTDGAAVQLCPKKE
eukprot:scaffold2262_cov312-Prasinococcus_capsulatus_cf.AAC.7